MARTRSDVADSITPRVVLDPELDGEEFEVPSNVGAHSEQPSTRTIRHAHLYLTRVDPWSVMKNAFMLSLAIAIVLVVATMILWGMLAASGSIEALTRTVDDIAGTGASAIDLTGLLSFGHVLTVTAAVAVMEIILVSALATLFAYMYNLAVGITGGLQLTLTEDN